LGYVFEDDDAFHGFRVAGVWDSSFGFGGMAGYQLAVPISARVEVTGGAGVRIMPEGNDRAEDIVRDRCGTADLVGFNPFTLVQPYFGVGLVFYFL
jgi:hypothetical protein